MKIQRDVIVELMFQYTLGVTRHIIWVMRPYTGSAIPNIYIIQFLTSNGDVSPVVTNTPGLMYILYGATRSSH